MKAGFPSLLHGGDFVPNLKLLLSFGTVLSNGEKMSLRSEMRSEEVVYFEKALCLLRRFEAPHPALTQARGLMRVFRPAVPPPIRY